MRSGYGERSSRERRADIPITIEPMDERSRACAVSRPTLSLNRCCPARAFVALLRWLAAIRQAGLSSGRQCIHAPPAANALVAANRVSSQATRGLCDKGCASSPPGETAFCTASRLPQRQRFTHNCVIVLVFPRPGECFLNRISRQRRRLTLRLLWLTGKNAEALKQALIA